MQCTATARKLTAENIPFVTVDILEPNNLAYVTELGYLQAPVVDAHNGNHWSGFQPDKITALAKRIKENA